VLAWRLDLLDELDLVYLIYWVGFTSSVAEFSSVIGFGFT
jgi:hypothetical protein